MQGSTLLALALLTALAACDEQPAAREPVEAGEPLPPCDVGDTPQTRPDCFWQDGSPK